MINFFLMTSIMSFMAFACTPPSGDLGNSAPSKRTANQQPATQKPNIPNSPSGYPSPTPSTTGQPTPTVITTPTNTDCYKGTPFICKIERLITDKTNAYRAGKGLKPLVHDAKISFVSRDWSAKQGQKNNISHSGFPEARSRVYQQEFSVEREFYGENVAMSGGIGGSSQSDAEAESIAQEFAVMWWNSPGHRANMLGSYDNIGVGVAVTNGGDWYATQIFESVNN